MSPCGAAVKVKTFFACDLLSTSVVFSETEKRPDHGMSGRRTVGFILFL